MKLQSWVICAADGQRRAASKTYFVFKKLLEANGVVCAPNCLSDRFMQRTRKLRLIDLLSGAKAVTAEKVSKTLDWKGNT